MARSPNFVERHELVVIIALGESIVAIGVGAAGLPLDAGEITAALLGITVDRRAVVVVLRLGRLHRQARLVEATGAERAALARPLLVHLPMVAGIVLFALRLKETLAHFDSPLGTIPAVGLCGGLALYFLAHVGARLESVAALAAAGRSPRSSCSG